MNKIKRYTIYENVSIEIPLLYGIKYLSERVQIKDCIFTVFASLDNPYSWDGSSPKWLFNGKIYGTPDGEHDELKYPTLVHDLLYEHRACSRRLADKSFLYLLKRNNFKLSYTYYLAVRLFGWIPYYL